MITPVVASIVATAGEPLDQTPPTTVEAKAFVVFVKQIAIVPLNVPATGAAVIVTVLVAVASAQPPEPATV